VTDSQAVAGGKGEKVTFFTCDGLDSSGETDIGLLCFLATGHGDGRMIF